MRGVLGTNYVKQFEGPERLCDGENQARSSGARELGSIIRKDFGREW